MVRQFLSRRMVSVIVSLIVIGAFVFNSATMGYALRPASTTEDSERLDDVAKMFGYGFVSGPGETLAHDKVFKVRAAQAFAEGRAIGISGNQAAVSLSDAAAEFLQKSGEVGITQEELGIRLLKAREFLGEIFSADFINRMIADIAKIDEAKVTKKALPFLRRIKEIAAIQDESLRAQEARKAVVDGTRFIAVLFGEKALDPYLFSVGNILSKEHRALVAHIGTFPYAGGENIAGGPRTVYTSLARIEGFAKLGQEGIEAYREMMLHEFMDLAYGRHIDPSAEVIARLNKINAAIDREYRKVIRGVVTKTQEEGSVIVSTPQVTVEKYRLVNDLGKKDAFAIKGSSKVHPDVPKGSGQKITVTIAKADVGSIGGHGTAPGAMLEAVAETWMRAAEQGLILDFFITRVGDDISVTVTHIKGKDNVKIHELIWNGFVNASVIAKDLGYYAAGQDLLADAFSGNVRGAGPSVAEMEFLEAGAEVLITGQADKTAPGAFNKGLWEILFSPNTTWRPLGRGQAKGIKVGMLDFDYNDSQGRRIDWTKEDYDLAAWYLGFPDRYTIDRVTLGTGEDFAAVTAQRLGKIAGEYVGKDDPMFMIRSQSAFPAVGEITSAFLKGEYIVPGWMRGSNKGPFFPVSLQDAKIGIYDGPPLLSMWSFNLSNGRLVGFYDLMAANPAIRYIQDRRAARAVALLEEGFGAGSETSLRVGPEEIEYQAAPKRMEKELEGRWEVFAPEEEGEAAADAQKAADATHEDVAQQVALAKVQGAAQQAYKLLWGKLAVFADEFAADIHHGLSAKVLEINSAKEGKSYPILISHEALLKTSPDGIMALQNIMEQLGKGNIKLVLHIARDDVKPEEADRIIDETLEAINKINGGYTTITRDMFAAVVVGTNPESVANQVREKVGAGIYQVIGPQDYAKQFKDVIRVVLDPANRGQLTLMAKALKLGVELIATDGKLPPQELKKLDELFSQDAEGNFHVASADVVASVVSAAEAYAKQVESEIRV